MKPQPNLSGAEEVAVPPRRFRSCWRVSPAQAFSRAAFTLIEIMVVVVLLSVIILGLMAMFTQTQRAFRAGMAQVDVLEGGRMGMELIRREIQAMTPGGVHGEIVATNYFLQLNNINTQSLVGTTSLRTNLMDDVFFLVRLNQNWIGIGYFVRPDSGLGGGTGSVGTLYRFQTNTTIAQFDQNPARLFAAFNSVRQMQNPPNVSRILNGVVDFKMRAYGTNGYWINPGLSGRISTNSSWSYLLPAEADYSFTNNAVPAAVEFELGILETQIYERYKSIPVPAAQESFLQNQAGHVHIFRQRVSIRNVDPAAYQ